MEYLIKALATIVDLVFRVYIFFLMLRFLLHWARADFYHPFAHFLLVVSNPPVRPLHKIMPRAGNIDLAVLLLMFVLQVIKVLLIHSLMGPPLGLFGMLLLSLAELLELALYIFIFSIVIQALLSWFPETRRNPLNTFLQRLNDPLLRPARHYIKPFEGMDLSPMVVVLVLYLLILLLVAPLTGLAIRL